MGGPAHEQRNKLTAASKAEKKIKGAHRALVLPLIFFDDLLRGYCAGGNSDPVSAQGARVQQASRNNPREKQKAPAELFAHPACWLLPQRGNKDG